MEILIISFCCIAGWLLSRPVINFLRAKARN